VGYAGYLYFVGALFLGLGFSYQALQLALRRSNAVARLHLWTPDPLFAEQFLPRGRPDGQFCLLDVTCSAWPPWRRAK
jgi:hypothetical protein